LEISDFLLSPFKSSANLSKLEHRDFHWTSLNRKSAYQSLKTNNIFARVNHSKEDVKWVLDCASKKYQ